MIYRLIAGMFMISGMACASPEFAEDVPGVAQQRKIQQVETRNSSPNQSASVANPNTKPLGTAKLVIMEFTDLECPDSAKYSAGLKGEIISRFVTSGAAEYEFHDFPLDAHPNARQAAAAARCAGDKVGAVRAAILQAGGKVEGALASAGVNGQAMQACLAKGTSLRAVDADRALGNSLGVRGTPTLIVGYRQADGTVRAVKTLRPDKSPGTITQDIAALLSSR